MALLTHLRTGQSLALTTPALVGRSPACLVSISSALVSSEHASLRWRGEEWWLRDLGSRNGTYVDGHAIGAGDEARLVVGARLTFGNQADPWVLEDAGPPGPIAVCLDRDARSWAQGAVLLLPDENAPQLAIVRHRSGQWIIDDGEQQIVRDGQTLRVGQERWKVSFPRVLDPTADATPRQVRLNFRVSRDEEYVEIDVVNGDQTTRMRPRSFNYLLLTLARHRLADHELPESSRGWVDQHDLAHELRVEHRTINVQLYRARRALGKVRDDLATRLVERRSRASQLRFGLNDVAIELI